MKRGILVISLVLSFASVSIAGGGAGGDRSSLPIQLKADELFTDSTNRTATFVGRVSARQGDITIYSDKLIINYSGHDNEVEKVEAFGNVRIVQGNRLGEAGHAIYDNKAGKIILDTNPKVHQGNDVVSGRVITYFLDDQKSVVTGGPDKRVEAEIHPKGKGKDGAKP